VPERGYFTLHQSIIDIQQIVFKVRSTNDAKIALLSVPSNVRAWSYELTIGAKMNTVTTLSYNSPSGDNVHEVSTLGILSDSELRSFWLTWVDGSVKFGRGSVVGVSEVLTFTDPDPAYRRFIHSLAVASLADEKAEWEFGSSFETGKTMFVRNCFSNLLLF
jgi:Farnesoic acid 0-methyl transferase